MSSPPIASPRPRRKAAARYHHGDLRAQLLRATVEIVRRDGPGAVTLRAVAARTGVSEAAPYHHFRDKVELLAAAAGESFRALDQRMQRAADDAGDDPAAQLVAVAGAWVRFALEERGSFRLIFGAHVTELALSRYPEAGVPGRAARQRVEAMTAAFVAQHPGEIDPQQLFRMIWAQVHGTASLVIEQELGPAYTAEDAIDLARDGVSRILYSFGDDRPR